MASLMRLSRWFVAVQPFIHGVTSIPMESEPLPDLDLDEMLIEPRMVPVVEPGSATHTVALPMMVPNMDTHHAAHLTPSMSTTHWYSVTPDQGDGLPVMIRMNMSHNYPVVALDHSLHVTDVTCLNDTDITANFVTADAYQHARMTWIDGEDLAVVTRAHTCSPDGQNTFHQVLGVSFNDSSSSVRLKCNRTHIHDVAGGYELEWGKMEPGGWINTNPSSTAPPNATDSSVPTAPGGSNGTANDAANRTVQGFPAVAPGQDFDQRLDNRLGYYSLDNMTDDEVLATAIGVRPGELQKRGLFDFVGDLVNNVVDTTTAVVNQAVDTVKTVASVATTAATAVVDVASAVVTFAATGMYSANIPFMIDQMAPDNDSPSPFLDHNNFNLFKYRPDPGGPNYTIAQAAIDGINNFISDDDDPEPGVDIWCVDCRFKGNFVAAGVVKATILDGVSQAQVSLTGSGVEGNIGIGANAFASYKTRTSKDLKVYPLGGWNIPDVIVLGPRLVLSATTDITVTALGQLYVAYNLKFSNVYAQYDFKSGTSTATGWTPQVSRTVNAAGTVSVVAGLGLPMKLNFQITILDKYSFSANVSNVPALVASAALSRGNTVGAAPCQGVTLALRFVDSLQVAVGSFDPKTLLATTLPVSSTCISLPTPFKHKERRETLPTPLSYLERREALPAPPKPRTLPAAPYPNILARQANANQTNDDDESVSAYPVEPCDIWDTTRVMQMHPNVNGNLFLNSNLTANVSALTGGNSFYKATTNNTDVVYGDKNQRVLHYYPETLDKLGVSRLRLATWQNLPKGSRVITMATVPYGTGNSTERMLMGVDAQGNYAWIYCCGIDNEPNKMFLAKDWNTAGTTLQSPEMQSIVTGGPAYACLPIAMNT